MRGLQIQLRWDSNLGGPARGVTALRLERILELLVKPGMPFQWDLSQVMIHRVIMQ